MQSVIWESFIFKLPKGLLESQAENPTCYLASQLSLWLPCLAYFTCQSWEGDCAEGTPGFQAIKLGEGRDGLLYTIKTKSSNQNLKNIYLSILYVWKLSKFLMEPNHRALYKNLFRVFSKDSILNFYYSNKNVQKCVLLFYHPTNEEVLKNVHDKLVRNKINNSNMLCQLSGKCERSLRNPYHNRE